MEKVPKKKARRGLKKGTLLTLVLILAAGVGAGLFEGYEQAAGIVRASSVHPVNPAWQAAYRPCQALYAQLYGRLSPLFEQIAAQ